MPKLRVGKPRVGDILTDIVNVKGFDELEGWDDEVVKSLLKFMIECFKVRGGKHTSVVFLAWKELDDSERECLLKHFSRDTLGMVGIMSSTTLGRMLEIQEQLKEVVGDIIGKIRDGKKEGETDGGSWKAFKM